MLTGPEIYNLSAYCSMKLSPSVFLLLLLEEKLTVVDNELGGFLPDPSFVRFLGECQIAIGVM